MPYQTALGNDTYKVMFCAYDNIDCSNNNDDDYDVDGDDKDGNNAIENWW